jgi:hypothetical protein
MLASPACFTPENKARRDVALTALTMGSFDPAATLVAIGITMSPEESLSSKRFSGSATRRDLFDRALHSNINNAQALACIADSISPPQLATLPDGRQLGVVELCLLALQINPELINPMVTLGLTLPPGGKIRLPDGTDVSRRNLFKRAIHLLPTQNDYGLAHAALARDLLDTGDSTTTLLDGRVISAMQLCLEAYSLNTLCADIFLQLGRAMRAGEHSCVRFSTSEPMATECDLHQQAARLDPRLVEAKYYAVSCRTSKALQSEVSKTLTALLSDSAELRRHNNEAWLQLAADLCDSDIASNDRHYDVCRFYIEILRLQPCSAHVLIGLAKAMTDDKPAVALTDGRLLTKKEVLLEALKCKPESACVYHLLADLCGAEPATLPDGRVLTQQQLYVEALYYDPWMAAAYADLAKTLPADGSVTLRTGKVMSKKELLAEELGIDPTNKTLRALLLSTLQPGATVMLLTGEKIQAAVSSG